MTNKLHAIVTGGCGRIGSELVKTLLKDGWRVTVIDLSEGSCKGVKYIKSQILDLKELPACDCLFHLAAKISYSASLDELRQANLVPTQHLLNLSKGTGVKRFVFLSTSSVYNESKKPITEDMAKKPYSLYGKSKLEAEYAVQSSGIPFVILRSSQVFGPQFKEGYLRVLKHIKKGDINIIGKGSNIIPLIHIKDLISALMFSAKNNEALSNIFNVDGNYKKSQEEFMALAAKGLRIPAPKSHISPFMAKLGTLFKGNSNVLSEYSEKLGKNREISIGKIMPLGWKPEVHLDFAMGEVISSFKKEGLL